jgi:hypothetical protein
VRASSDRNPQRLKAREIAAVGRRLDRAGATASLVCAIHCALMPLALTLLPLFGLAFLADERLEWTLVGASALLGITSLCLGYREHRSRRALAVLAAGLGLLAAGRIAESHQTGMWGAVAAVMGGILVATSHLINRRLCDTCHACNHADSGDE